MEIFLEFLFYFLALAAILCAKQFKQFWWRTSQGTILSSLAEISQGVMKEILFEVLVEICPIVTVEMLFEVFFLFLALAASLCIGVE